MTQQELLREFLALPADEQRAVVDLFASFQQQNPSAAPADVAKPIDFSTDPFVGMWKARQDLADSSAWVRNVRRNDAVVMAGPG